jgi:hypothetical protein
MNYIYNTGAFAGRVSEEGATILDVPFHDLDADLQRRIVEMFESRYNETIDMTDAEELEAAKTLYEFLWESEETDQPVDLTPFSTWG